MAEICYRADGRVEVICPHGVGHPSEELQNLRGQRPWAKFDGIHGCDGCCDHPDWLAAEQKAIRDMQQKAKV